MASTQEQLISLMNAGKECLEKDDYIGAERNFEQVIKQAPLYPGAYFSCATVQYLQRKNVEALINLDAAVALLPKGNDLAAAYHNRALIYIDLDGIVESVSDLKAAIALNFEASEEELERVSKMLEDKDIPTPESIAAKEKSWCDEAREAFPKSQLHSLVLFKKATDLNPDSINAMFGIGLANSALGRMDEALESFADVLNRVQPEHAGLKAETLYNRSAILKQKGEVNEAIVDLQECLSLSMDEMVSFPVLGSAEKEQEMIEDIRRELEEWKKEQY